MTLSIDTKHDDDENYLKNEVMSELVISNKREIRNIINYLGVDVIPFLTTWESKTYDQNLSSSSLSNHHCINPSIEIDLSHVQHLPRLLSVFISKINEKETCQERVMSLQFLSSISERQQNNKLLIASYPGMLEALVKVNNMTEMELKQVTKIIYELSKALDNRVMMMRKSYVIDALLGTMKNNNKNQDNSTILECHSIETLMYLSEISENKVSMVNYKHGILLDAIVNAACTMSNTKVCCLALQTIHNLICVETVDVMIGRTKNFEVANVFPFQDVLYKRAKVLQKLCFFSKEEKGEDLLAAILQIVGRPWPCSHDEIFIIGLESLLILSKRPSIQILIAENVKIVNILHKYQDANDNIPAKQLLAIEILSQIASHQSAVKLLAKQQDLVCQLFATIVHGKSSGLKLRIVAMKAFLKMIKNKQAALTIIDRKLMPSLARFVCSCDEDKRLTRPMLKALVVLTPMM